MQLMEIELLIVNGYREDSYYCSTTVTGWLWLNIDWANLLLIWLPMAHNSAATSHEVSVYMSAYGKPI